jgi:hypothetical protein
MKWVTVGQDKGWSINVTEHVDANSAAKHSPSSTDFEHQTHLLAVCGKQIKRTHTTLFSIQTTYEL